MFPFSELPNDYVVTFGASDSFGTSEYALLEGKPFPNLTEVRIDFLKLLLTFLFYNFLHFLVVVLFLDEHQ